MIGSIIHIALIGIPLLTEGLICFIAVSVVFNTVTIMSTGSIEIPVLRYTAVNNPVMIPSEKMISSTDTFLRLRDSCEYLYVFLIYFPLQFLQNKQWSFGPHRQICEGQRRYLYTMVPSIFIRHPWHRGLQRFEALKIPYLVLLYNSKIIVIFITFVVPAICIYTFLHLCICAFMCLLISLVEINAILYQF